MNTQVVQRRPLGALGRMGIVAAIHAGAFYLIATTLVIVPPLIADPPSARLMPVVEQPTEPPIDTPRPRAHQPEIFVPEPVLDNAPSEQPDVITARPIDDLTPIPDPIPQPAGPEIVGARADSRYPFTQPPYPMSEVRNGSEGFVDLELYVLPTGRIGDVRVLRSTGYPALDQSAMAEAKKRWRMLPATRDGVPFAQWHRLRVVFKLENRR